jgi:hypothetical protein
MRTHGALTEDSRSDRVVTHDRKGREGKGDRKGMWLRSIHDLRLLAGDKRMGDFVASSRGVR